MQILTLGSDGQPPFEVPEGGRGKGKPFPEGLPYITYIIIYKLLQIIYKLLLQIITNYYKLQITKYKVYRYIECKGMRGM